MENGEYKKMTQQFIDLGNRLINKGVWLENARTGTSCLTIINADLTYDVAGGILPLETTRQSFYKSAIAELLGYLRGYDNAADFRRIGTKTWDANANENAAWLANPNRKGIDDCGMIYGKIARNFPTLDGGTIDLVRQVYNNLKAGIDTRDECITFRHPGAFNHACLRPCMYEHRFSLLGETLFLNSTQRSCDLPLGLNFNMVQVYVLLALMAQITGKQAGEAYHKLINIHCYKNQYELLKDVQLQRTPLPPPTMTINPDIKTLEDVETWVTPADFIVHDYVHHSAIKYPFSV
jgi:thymidylate synthase